MLLRYLSGEVEVLNRLLDKRVLDLVEWLKLEIKVLEVVYIKMVL